MESVFGIILLLISVISYFYLSRRVKIPFSWRKPKDQKLETMKFENKAPVAPDMLFGNDDDEIPQYEQQPRPQFTSPKDTINPTDLQQRVARLMWYLRQVSTVYVNQNYMVFMHKQKKIAACRCVEGRLHIGHVDEIIKINENLHLQLYIVVIGKIDLPAFKLAMRKNVKIIDKQKLDSLHLRIAYIPQK